MSGITDLEKLLQTMSPKLNEGTFIFYSTKHLNGFNPEEAVMLFREDEGYTLILSTETADKLGIEYSFVSSWITLMVHSSLEAVGLTAAFSTALGHAGISCNVVAGFYHDHIFVDTESAEKAMKILNSLSEK